MLWALINAIFDSKKKVQGKQQHHKTDRDIQLLLETNGTTFEVKPIGENYFMHTPTGYFFEFFPGKGELQVKETDNIYFFKRENQAALAS